MSQAQEFEKVLSGSDTSVASFEEQGTSFVKKLQHFLHSTPAAVPLIVLVMAIIIFGVSIGGRFFSTYTLTLILQQIAVVGILGAAQTLVILTAGIDLSIGVVMVISAVVMGNFAVVYGWPAIIAVPIGLAVGALCGLLNGALVAYVKLPPFIVTLGTWNIVMATNFIYSANETIRDTDVAEKAPLLHLFGTSFKVGGAVLTLGVIAMVLLVLLLWYVLNHTAWGRYLYAIGGNEKAAQMTGVPVERIKLQAYIVCSLTAAIAAIMIVGWQGSAINALGQGYELRVIASTVIGGANLMGGEGGAFGAFIGAALIEVIRNSLLMAGVDANWQGRFVGVFIILAVLLERVRGGRSG